MGNRYTPVTISEQYGLRPNAESLNVIGPAEGPDFAAVLLDKPTHPAIYSPLPLA